MLKNHSPKNNLLEINEFLKNEYFNKNIKLLQTNLLEKIMKKLFEKISFLKIIFGVYSIETLTANLELSYFYYQRNMSDCAYSINSFCLEKYNDIITKDVSVFNEHQIYLLCKMYIQLLQFLLSNTSNNKK